MSIPTYGATAHGGKIISLDDQSVVKDLADATGTGGNAYIGYFLSGLFAVGGGQAYDKLRRMTQRVPHDGTVTVTVTPWRDGLDTGQTITRTLTPDDNPVIVVPLAVTGSHFQLRIALSSFDAPASLGSGSFRSIPRRSQR